MSTISIREPPFSWTKFAFVCWGRTNETKKKNTESTSLMHACACGLAIDWFNFNEFNLINNSKNEHTLFSWFYWLWMPISPDNKQCNVPYVTALDSTRCLKLEQSWICEPEHCRSGNSKKGPSKKCAALVCSGFDSIIANICECVNINLTFQYRIVIGEKQIKQFFSPAIAHKCSN